MADNRPPEKSLLNEGKLSELEAIADEVGLPTDALRCGYMRRPINVSGVWESWNGRDRLLVDGYCALRQNWCYRDVYLDEKDWNLTKCPHYIKAFGEYVQITNQKLK